jgi:hypothetical protein
LSFTFADSLIHFRGLLDEVPSGDVVDVAVPVVVELVAGNLVDVAPEVGGEVLVRGVDARVDHGDHHARSSGGVPERGRLRGLQSPEVGIRLAPGAGGADVQVVRRVAHAPLVNGLGVDDVGIRRQRRGRRGDVGIRGQLELVDAGKVARGGVGGATAPAVRGAVARGLPARCPRGAPATGQ